ncbi:hypothetical protein EON63_23655 [archaeon]|nr:MAG: hypothetical protein EON63_23655 [archaeon]
MWLNEYGYGYGYRHGYGYGYELGMGMSMGICINLNKVLHASHTHDDSAVSGSAGALSYVASLVVR